MQSFPRFRNVVYHINNNLFYFVLSLISSHVYMYMHKFDKYFAISNSDQSVQLINSTIKEIRIKATVIYQKKYSVIWNGNQSDGNYCSNATYLRALIITLMIRIFVQFLYLNKHIEYIYIYMTRELTISRVINK